MQEFKIGDWVRDTRQGMKNPIVQLKSNCIALTNPKEYATQYELWQPQEGEWVIPNTKTTESFNVFRYTENYKGFDLQPFIGELPSFLKETDNATN